MGVDNAATVWKYVRQSLYLRNVFAGLLRQRGYGVKSKRIELMTAPHDAIDPTAAAIVKATLLHVPFDGWGVTALS